MTIDMQKSPDRVDDEGLGPVEGVPGQDLAVRADDDLELRAPSDLVPYRPVQTLVVRARQATARGWVLVVDQPAVIRAAAVGKQSPRVAAHLAGTAPKGVVRAVARLDRYLRDPESLELMTRCAEQQDAVGYEKAANAREKKNLPGRRRGVLGGVLVVLVVALAWWAPQAFAGVLAMAVLAGGVVVAVRSTRGKELLCALGLAVGLAVAAWYGGPWLAAHVPQPPAWVWWTLAGISVPVLGWLGHDRDQPLVELPPRTVPASTPKLTAPMVIAALCALGNSKMKDPDAIRVLMDPHRSGQGVQIDLELPPGTTASYVVENREKFAGALRLELGTVWPSVGRRHPDHLSLFVSDQVMAEAEQDIWALASAPRVDIFDMLPAFTNQPGKWVPVCLAYASWVIGAAPRMGKTFLVRQLLLMAGLDPRVKVVALDGKGTGDLAPCALYAHAYVRGARVTNPENIEKVRGIVRWLLEELGRRADIIDSLPDDECPESKVTSALIDAHPELDLGPIVVGVDETQSFFSYGFKSVKEHKEIREEIRDGFVELMKLGPAVGIWVILATQLVRESTIPTEAAAVAVNRFALKLEGGHEPNDRILGTGSYSRGVDANMFDFADKGIGFLKAEGSRSVICRSVYGLDAPEARRIAQRCRQMRAAAGQLTGDAAGDDDITDAEIVIDIIEDVEQVMRQHGRAKAQHGELVEWLRELREQHYAALDVDELSAALRARHVRISQVWSIGRNAKGVKASDLRRRSTEPDDDEPIGR